MDQWPSPSNPLWIPEWVEKLVQADGTPLGEHYRKALDEGWIQTIKSPAEFGVYAGGAGGNAGYADLGEKCHQAWLAAH